jgi:uncharacterized protein
MKYSYVVFSTGKNNYFFDGVSCNIFSINDGIYYNHEYLFQNLTNNTFDSDNSHKNEYNEIFEVIENGYLMENSKMYPDYWFDTNEYKNELNSNINHLMIELTEKCNFRCKYCVYGGHYSNERKHGEKSIDEISLEKAIEFFFLNSEKAKERVINFYGGEPFIEFTKMREIVEKINKIDPKIKYFITTNAALLKDDVAKWFLETDNIYLFVSLAGVPFRHDELRILADGKSTFELIKRNLLNIKKTNKNIYINRINFIFNIFDEVQLEEINNFWFTDELFFDAVHLPEITYIDCVEDDGAIRELANKITNEYQNGINSLNLYISLLKDKSYKNLIVKYFDKKFLSIHRRSLNEDRFILASVCRPFINKIFIDVYGQVNICENFKFGGKFGTISNFLNINIINELLNEYKNYRTKKCKYCWALKICSLCFKDLFENSGKINYERVEYLCNKERENKKQILIEYCTILEEGETLLDHLDNYKIYKL